MNKKNPRKKTRTRAGARAGTQAAASTHEDRIKTALDELKPNITSSDRRALRQHFSLASSTISKYLGGNIMNVETGLEILMFLNDRVTAREDRLKTISV